MTTPASPDANPVGSASSADATTPYAVGPYSPSAQSTYGEPMAGGYSYGDGQAGAPGAGEAPVARPTARATSSPTPPPATPNLRSVTAPSRRSLLGCWHCS